MSVDEIVKVLNLPNWKEYVNVFYYKENICSTANGYYVNDMGLLMMMKESTKTKNEKLFMDWMIGVMIPATTLEHKTHEMTKKMKTTEEFMNKLLNQNDKLIELLKLSSSSLAICKKKKKKCNSIKNYGFNVIDKY